VEYAIRVPSISCAMASVRPRRVPDQLLLGTWTSLRTFNRNDPSGGVCVLNVLHVVCRSSHNVFASQAFADVVRWNRWSCFWVRLDTVQQAIVAFTRIRSVHLVFSRHVFKRWVVASSTVFDAARRGPHLLVTKLPFPLDYWIWTLDWA
jgi:hypothetical protein